MKYDKPIASAVQTGGFTDYERALRYALGLPGVGTAVVGVFSEEELEQNVEWIRRYQPLTVEEEESLLPKVARSQSSGDLILGPSTIRNRLRRGPHLL